MKIKDLKKQAAEDGRYGVRRHSVHPTGRRISATVKPYVEAHFDADRAAARDEGLELVSVERPSSGSGPVILIYRAPAPEPEGEAE